MLEEKLCWKGERGLLRIGYLQLLTGTPVSCEHSNIKCFGGGASPGGFPGGTVVKNPPANAGNTGSSPGPGRSHVPRSK